MVGPQQLSETDCYLNGYTSVCMTNVGLLRNHPRKHGLKDPILRQMRSSPTNFIFATVNNTMVIE